MDRRSIDRFDHFCTKIGVVQKLALLKIGDRSQSIWHEGGMPDEIELFKRPNLVTFTCKLLSNLAFPLAKWIGVRSF
jgi:hypothetical protein